MKKVRSIFFLLIETSILYALSFFITRVIFFLNYSSPSEKTNLINDPFDLIYTLIMGSGIALFVNYILMGTLFSVYLIFLYSINRKIMYYVSSILFAIAVCYYSLYRTTGIENTINFKLASIICLVSLYLLSLYNTFFSIRKSSLFLSLVAVFHPSQAKD